MAIIVPYSIYWQSTSKPQVTYNSTTTQTFTPTPKPVQIIQNLTTLEIAAPQSETSVPQYCTVEGSADGQLPPDMYLYVVVQYANEWWPQASNLSVRYSSVSQRYEFSAPVQFGLQADYGKSFTAHSVLVDSGVHQSFQSWFQSYRNIADRPGIPYTDIAQSGQASIYDSVTVIRQP
ncbi:MAG: hypothetical protein NWE93_02500 [Candidatus Bathyarchaeota archaeon]|nr:hypothetical protein [Candidatus Bathyarchaeota archaeon]